jgi:hypothetical protein
MAGCLNEDHESDIFDVANGNLPPEYGRFVPQDERDGSMARPEAENACELDGARQVPS